MGRPSRIDRLPADLRELIGRLRAGGRTIDEILAKLRELDVAVSRSALGRHVKEVDAIAAEIQRSRGIAEAIVERFGDAPESRTARLNIELMHSQMMRLLVAEEGQTLTLEPQDAYFLSSALQKLAQAAKQDVERELKIRQEVVGKAADKAVAAADEQARKAGHILPPEALRAIREQVYGIVDESPAGRGRHASARAP
jgi:hypothetical protein